ncbi:MAG: ABC transporter ATP-binding protein [Rhodospirillales bacterium]|nr:ABC transporter ATP-binding protein [Rhodospirillales bacterium]
MLEVADLCSGYDDVPIVRGVSFRVETGQVVSIVGANGAGKTTTLKTISGLLPATAGSIAFNGTELVGKRPSEIVALGIAHVPEGRQLFTDMTVRENLTMGAYLPLARSLAGETMDQVLEMFPRLRERVDQIAGTLSGGEQQMLAIGRGLMLRPKLLILDEPSLGLSPKLVATMFGIISRIRQTGISILMVEQNLVQSLKSADFGYILETGRVAWQGASRDLLEDERTRSAYLGLLKT